MNTETTLNYSVEQIESNPGSNLSFQAQKITIEVPGGSLGLTVEGRTHGRNGCRIRVFDENKSEMMNEIYYSGFGVFPIPIGKITKDVHETLTILMGEEKDFPLSLEDIYPAIKKMVSKCESRYGNLIPNSKFESQIVFSH